jgi:Fe-S oxidoreductase
MKKQISIKDIGRQEGQLVEIRPEDLVPLPYPYDKPGSEPAMKQLTADQKKKYETSLDGISAIGLKRPETREEEEEFVTKFLSGLKKLLSKENNWTFLQPLVLSLENCAKCQNCSDACPVYTESGRQEIYRPTYRAEVLRRIIRRHLKKEGKLLAKFTGSDIDLNYTTVARLAELAYRCTLCRRCAQSCPIGVDNGLITHEIRKIFSQELGIAPKEIHESGTVKQLKTGSSTGTTPKALQSFISFIEGEIEEKTGKPIKLPIDKMGADVLLMHNTGEFISWPENVAAFAIIFEAAGVDWTLSSKLMGYDAVNYGVWYDDIQFSRIAVRHMQAARELKVNRVLVGECGHAHKAMLVIADRVLTGDLNIPRESAIPLLADIVLNGKIRLDASRNNFPVTLHDPCNLVRLSGIVEPQRRILRKICPDFREMEPHGVDNYCCGGGSGFAVMDSNNFSDWRSAISGRMKLRQIINAFQDVIRPDIHKYVCAPCSNCKGQIRDLFNYYDVSEKCGIRYGGLVELIVNAMVDIKGPFISWEEEL